MHKYANAAIADDPFPKLFHQVSRETDSALLYSVWNEPFQHKTKLGMDRAMLTVRAVDQNETEYHLYLNYDECYRVSHKSAKNWSL